MKQLSWQWVCSEFISASTGVNQAIPGSHKPRQGRSVRALSRRDDGQCHAAGSCLSLMEETQIKSYLQKLLFPRYQYENNPFLKINSSHTSKVEYIKCCKKEKNSSCRDDFRNFRVCRGNPELLAYFFYLFDSE